MLLWWCGGYGRHRGAVISREVALVVVAWCIVWDWLHLVGCLVSNDWVVGNLYICIVNIIIIICSCFLIRFKFRYDADDASLIFSMNKSLGHKMNYQCK